MAIMDVDAALNTQVNDLVHHKDIRRYVNAHANKPFCSGLSCAETSKFFSFSTKGTHMNLELACDATSSSIVDQRSKNGRCQSILQDGHRR